MTIAGIRSLDSVTYSVGWFSTQLSKDYKKPTTDFMKCNKACVCTAQMFIQKSVSDGEKNPEKSKDSD